MSITVIPDFPEAGDPNFSSLAYASFQATKQAIDDLNQVGAAYALSTNTTSTTSNTIGTGSKTFTVQTNLGYVVGMTIRAASTASPINYVTGIVTSYVKTTGVLIINVPTGGDEGSGTFTAWTLSLAAVGANSAGDISNVPAGNIVSTNVQNAIDELDTEKAGLSANNTFTGTNSFQGLSATGIDSTPIGATNPDEGTFTTLIVDGEQVRALVQETSKTATGTSIDFTSIPSWAKTFSVIFDGVSTNGTSNIIIQIGDSGGFENTGYLGSVIFFSGGSATGTNPTNGFGVTTSNAAANVYHGKVDIDNRSSNNFVSSGIVSVSNAVNIYLSAGSKSLTDTLDRIRITTVNGTDAFDAGSINIIYEG